ncbi:MAG TPA: hypothetical protein VGE27_15900 [Gemmatimonas sp.]|uniref:hypothetical protein n=1 Tax=Gemmatimonas sp. TaxID=1962908 RepID=UPI002ED991CB
MLLLSSCKGVDGNASTAEALEVVVLVDPVSCRITAAVGSKFRELREMAGFRARAYLVGIAPSSREETRSIAALFALPADTEVLSRHDAEVLRGYEQGAASVILRVAGRRIAVISGQDGEDVLSEAIADLSRLKTVSRDEVQKKSIDVSSSGRAQ